MPHVLPELPFPKDSLAPHISAETFDYHHGKHHNAYVGKLNELIAGTEFESASLEDIIKRSKGGIFNNAAQHFNHSFYWKCLSPTGGGAPTGALAAAIDAKWGSLAAFQEEFAAKCATLFGSGWVFLVKSADGSLAITQEPNAGCPLTSGVTPLMTCDVWEHAYYIDQRNARPAYVKAFWNVVNWNFVASNL